MTPPTRRLFLWLMALTVGSALTAPALSADPSQSTLGRAAPPFKVVAEPFPHPDESWATPALTHTHLTPNSPLVLQTEDRPTFTRQVVRVQWRKGDPMELYVIRPKGVARPPTVLYLYGYPSETGRFLLDSYCERITHNGCAAIGFESALTGGRYHDRPMREWFVSQLNESLAESAHDVHYVIDYLETRGDLDMTRVGMFGQGSGGAVAILAAGADPRIKALDLLQPWGDWPDWLKKSTLVPEDERPSYVTPGFAARVKPLDPVLWLPRLKDRHIRMLQFDDDTDTPAAAQQALAGAAPTGSEIKSFPTSMNAYGRYSGGRLFDWMGQQLNAAPIAGGPTPPKSGRSAAATH